MTRDERKLLKALRGLPYVRRFHVFAAYTLLHVNGLKNALEYVEAVRRSIQPKLQLMAADESGGD